MADMTHKQVAEAAAAMGGVTVSELGLRFDRVAVRSWIASSAARTPDRMRVRVWRWPSLIRCARLGRRRRPCSGRLAPCSGPAIQGMTRAWTSTAPGPNCALSCATRGGRTA